MQQDASFSSSAGVLHLGSIVMTNAVGALKITRSRIRRFFRQSQKGCSANFAR
jgi:hypothetical protein